MSHQQQQQQRRRFRLLGCAIGHDCSLKILMTSSSARCVSRVDEMEQMYHIQMLYNNNLRATGISAIRYSLRFLNCG